MIYNLKEIAIILISLLIIVLCLIFFPDTNIELINKKDFIYTGDLENVDYQKVNQEILKMDLDDKNYSIIELGSEYINIYDNGENHFIDLQTGESRSFDELINDMYKDLFYDYFYKELRVKYPKFIADNLYNQGFTNFIVKNDSIIVYFDNNDISPVIKEDLSIELICKDYKDMIKYDCDPSIEKDPNIVNLDPNKKTVALTFDDGPNNNTLSVLEALRNNNMSATFFELGPMMQNYPSIVKQIRKEGHEIGSHTYSHSQLNKLGVLKANEEINIVQNIYSSITGENILLTRPPYGSMSKKVREGTNAIYINWSVDSLDWKYKDTESIIKNVMSSLHDGDIILMHDIHKSTGESLNTLLPLLYSEGYQVVSVSQLASLKGYNLENHNVYFKFKNK